MSMLTALHTPCSLGAVRDKAKWEGAEKYPDNILNILGNLIGKSVHHEQQVEAAGLAGNMVGAGTTSRCLARAAVDGTQDLRAPY